MLFQASTLTAFCALSVAHATGDDGNAKQTGLRLAQDNKKRVAPSSEADSKGGLFVPARILRQRVNEEEEHLGNPLKNPVNKKLETISKDKHDLGILTNDHSLLNPTENNHQPDRKLQGRSCNEYCRSFGDRPVISNSVPFRDQVKAFPFGGPSPINCWNTSLVTDMSYAFADFDFFDGINFNNPNFFDQISFNSPLDCWDTSAVTDMKGMFKGRATEDEDGDGRTIRFNKFNQALDSWDTSAVTDMSTMFEYSLFNQAVDLWDTSAVNNMKFMFAGAINFKQEVDSWDTSAVTNMEWMFQYATEFNRPVDSWDTSAVTDMGFMFRGAKKFNQPVNSWDTSAVTNMKSMFERAAFNLPVDSWDTSAVRDMSEMFLLTSRFNQAVDSWNTSAVTDMSRMFIFADDFNQPVDSWDTSNVRSMNRMFHRALAFNQTVDSWDTSAVTDMNRMFGNARAFNQAVGSWNTSSVKDMEGMFFVAAVFNQAVDAWDTSAVTRMTDMFNSAPAFNQAVDSWDTSAVTSMDTMFYDATEFNQCISTWAIKTNNNVDTTRMFQSSGCPDRSTPRPNVGPWCQEVSDVCSPPPTVSPRPTISPAPTGAPSNVASESPTKAPVEPTSAPTNAPCKDAPATTKFDFVNNGREVEQRSCRFIRNTLRDADKPRQRRKALCEEEATIGDQTGLKIWSMCPRACKICPDQCKNKRGKFTIGNKPQQRNCGYLEARRNRQGFLRKVCDSKVRLVKSGKRVPLKNICVESCGKVGLGRCSPMLEKDSIAV